MSSYVSCNKIRELRKDTGTFNCCESCHLDDEEFGYDLCAVDDPDGGIGNHSGGVCCSMYLYLESHPLTKEEWNSFAN